MSSSTGGRTAIIFAILTIVSSYFSLFRIVNNQLDLVNQVILIPLFVSISMILLLCNQISGIERESYVKSWNFIFQAVAWVLFVGQGGIQGKVSYKLFERYGLKLKTVHPSL